MMTTTVVVIGGGATGLEVLRGLCERGVDAVLVEQGELEPGTGAAGWARARILDHAQVTAVRHAWNRISGVSARHVVTGARIDVTCDVVVNAAGARADQIADLAGLCLAPASGPLPAPGGGTGCAVRDHARDGVRGLFTVAGGAPACGHPGADAAAEAICRHLGRSAA